MIPCEVTNANNTGKPCPNPGTETAELIYPSGVSETKRCCPEHAAMVEKASAAARSVLAERVRLRREESDARADRVAARRRLDRSAADPVPPVTPAEETTMPEPTKTSTERGSPAQKPSRHAPTHSTLSGVKPCRACGKAGGYPLCKADRERVRKLRLAKLLPSDFDAKTSPISILADAWSAFKAQNAAPVEPDEDKNRADALLAAAIENGETTAPAPNSSGSIPYYVGKNESEKIAELRAAGYNVNPPDVDPRDAEIARLRAALVGQTLANVSLREQIVVAERERDEAVQSIAALRADADELRALREVLVSGKGRGIGKESLDALNAAEARMLDAVRERTRSHDDRTVGILKFAVERILDSIATAARDGKPADLGLLSALRVIATGEVPKAMGVGDAR